MSPMSAMRPRGYGSTEVQMRGVDTCSHMLSVPFSTRDVLIFFRRMRREQQIRGPGGTGGESVRSSV